LILCYTFLYETNGPIGIYEDENMKKDILKELHLETRDDAVRFLKSLWAEEPQPCPLCGGMLDYMHKKAKKSNSNWKCTSCGKVYKAINILEELPDR
jgi:transposase-like protein